MLKPPLTQEKKKWAANRNTTLRGVRLSYNASQQAKYQRALRKLVQRMVDETKKQIIKLFNGELADDYFDQQEEVASMDDKNIIPVIASATISNSIAKKSNKLVSALTAKFQQLFNMNADPIATGMIRDTAKTSETNLHVSLKQLSGGLSIKTGVVPDGMEDVAQALINENVSLIKSIPQQYFTDISGAVMRSITTGNGLADLVPAIQRHTAQTYRRVKNIALDQTRKAYNSINKQRMQAIGVKQFEWVHSGGGQHPRRSHIRLGQPPDNIYSFDDLPVINEEQVEKGYEQPIRGIPGQAINCRCTMTPVIKFDDE